jgi:hypothetical protein
MHSTGHGLRPGLPTSTQAAKRGETRLPKEETMREFTVQGRRVLLDDDMAAVADVVGLKLIVSSACPDSPALLFQSTQVSTAMLHPGRGYVVDHINGDRLDNRRENLQVITQWQNMMKSRHTPHPGVSPLGPDRFRFKTAEGRYVATRDLEAARRGADAARRAAGIRGMPLNFPEVGEHYWDGRLRSE